MRPRKIDLTLKGPNYRDWKAFEKRIAGEANMNGLFCIKIPETSRKIPSGPNGFNLILTKSSVDFVLAIDGRAHFFDAKVCGDRTFNLKKFCYDEKKIHQLLQLQAARDRGSRAGYMIWWGAFELISWAPIEAIEMAWDNGDLSISPETPGVKSQTEREIINFRRLLL